MKNHIVDITIGAEALTAMSAAASTLGTQIAAFGIHLDEAERKHSQKLGMRNETFARDMLDLAQQRPDVIPPHIQAAALERDLTAREQLTPLLFEMRGLLRTLEDTYAALGIDLFNGTLAMYKAVKPIAKTAGVQDTIRLIGQRFAGQGKKKTPTTPATPQPNNA